LVRKASSRSLPGPWRGPAPTVAALVLGAFLILTAFHLALTLLGVALWGFATWRFSRTVPDGKGTPLFSDNEIKDHRPRPSRHAGALSLTVLLLPVTLFFFQRSQVQGAWVLALGALALFVAILALLERTQSPFGAVPERKGDANRWAGVSLIVLGGVFLFYRFGQVPFWMDNDSANCIADALYFAHGETKTPFKTVWGDNPALPYMLYGLSFKVFGPSFEAGALVVAVFHLACLPLFYGFCRHFLSREAAWLSVCLLVASRWVLFFVRTPREASLLPAFEVAALYFFVRAWEGGRKRDFALFGLFLALVLQTYLPSRAVLLFFLVVLGGLAVRRWPLVRKDLPRWGLAFGTFGLFYSPMVVWYITHPEVVLDRMKRISILHLVREEGSLAPLWKNVSEGLWAFNVRGGTDSHYNLMGAPLLDPLSGLCFWIGLAWCLSRSFRVPFLFLMVGFLAGLSGMVFGDTPGHPMRAIASAPFVFLLAGIGADRSARALGTLLPAWRRPLVFLFLGAVAVSALSWNFEGFFRKMTRDKVFLDSNNRYEFLAGKVLAPYPKGWDIYMDFDGFMHTYVATYKRAEMFNFLPDFSLPIQRVPTKGAVVLLDGLGAAVEDLLSEFYPKATFRRIPYPGGGQAFWSWEMDQEQVREAVQKPFPPEGRGLWIRSSDKEGRSVGARWWPALFGVHKWARTWGLDHPVHRTSFTLTESRPLRFRLRGKLRLWVDGKEWKGATAEWEEGSYEPAQAPPKGSVIKIEYSPGQGVYRLDLFWEQEGRFVPVPSRAYRSPRPSDALKVPVGAKPENAFVMMPDW